MNRKTKAVAATVGGLIVDNTYGLVEKGCSKAYQSMTRRVGKRYNRQQEWYFNEDVVSKCENCPTSYFSYWDNPEKALCSEHRAEGVKLQENHKRHG